MLGRAAAVVWTVAALVGAPAGAQAAAGGSVSGTVSGVPAAGSGDASVRVLSGATGAVVAVATPTKRGAFTIKLPADGAYVVSTSVVARGRPVATTAIPVSVRKGQRRKGLKLTPRRGRTKAKAKRSYVQENGAVTAGVTAFTIEDFTGGTGEWQQLNRGLTDMLVTDLAGGQTACASVVTANSRDRKLIEAELDLQKSKYFDPKSRVKRNFILNDLVVSGTLTTSADGQSAAVRVTITDARTGKLVDALQTTMSANTFFEQEQELAKRVAERVCRRPAAYTLALNATSDATFATHTASAGTQSQLTALRFGGTPQAPTAWSGIAPFAWGSLTARATGIADSCTATPAGAPSSTWSASISVVDDATISVSWDPSAGGGIDMASITFVCRSDSGSVTITGQGGPSFVGVTPLTSTLPMTGGSIPLGGGIQSGGFGWIDGGTLTVTPVWATDPS